MKKKLYRALSLALTVLTLYGLTPSASAIDLPSGARAYASGYHDPVNRRVYAYLDHTLTERNNEWFTVDEEIKLLKVDFAHQAILVEYSTPSGSKQRWAPIQALFVGTAENCFVEVVCTRRVDGVFKNAGLTSDWGAIYEGDVCIVSTAKQSRGYRIFYPAGSSYKLAFISEEDFNNSFARVDAAGSADSGTGSVFWNVPVYRQYDYPNSYIGSKTIKAVGCLVTCISMVYSFDQNTQIAPPEMVSRYLKFSNNDLIWSSLLSLGNYTRQTYNRKADQAMLKELYDRLHSGPVILGGKGSGQHWIVVSGCHGDRQNLRAEDFSIVDPNSTSRTNLAQFLQKYPQVLSMVW